MQKGIFKIITLAALLAMLSAASLFAQGSITVESQVDRSTILIGDVFQYSVIVTHDTDVAVQMPELAANLGMFEIRDYKVLEPAQKEGKIISQTNYLLSTFDTGEFAIPELQIGYTTTTDSTVRFIKTEPLTITVQSLNPEEKGDIRDIKAPLTPPREYRQYIITGLILLAVVAAVVVLIYYLRRRRQGKALLPTRQKPPRPVHETALEELQELAQSDLLATGQIKEYYIRLSDIIRRYIEGRFFIYAPEMTTSQLLDKMRDERIETQYIDMTGEFLSSCDLVKFAKYVPEPAETNIITQLAFDFVEQTKMIMAQPEVAAPAGEAVAEPATASNGVVTTTVDSETEEAR
ncbi:MAG TPA: BatD family protein [bacterium]|nr:BatD family protein [bacterium]HPN44518.1 BatD family protein [bacterium]